MMKDKKILIIILLLLLSGVPAVSSSAATDTECKATVSNDLTIHIPCLTLGTSSYWLDFAFVTDPNYWLWKLSAGNVNPTATGTPSWNWYSLDGTYTSSVFLSESHIVAGAAYNFWGGLYTSADGGKTMTVTNANAVTHINRVRFAKDSRGLYTNTGYAVGGWQEYGWDSYLGRTADGGYTWADITSALTSARRSILNLSSAILLPLYGLSVLDDNTLFVLGYIRDLSSTTVEIYKSFDGGGTWQAAGKMTLDSDEGIKAWTLQVFSSSTGIVASNKYLYSTANGGSSWGRLNAPWSNDQGLVDNTFISFVDSSNGFALVGSKAKLYKTTNGGASWSLVYDQWPPANNPSWAPDGTYPFMLYAQTALELWAGGSDSRIWHSVDGGNTWAIEFNSDGYQYITSFQLIPGRTNPVAFSRYSTSSPGSNGYLARTPGNDGNLCSATFSSEGVLHIPCLLLGSSSYWLDLIFFPNYLPPSDIAFTLTGSYGLNP